MPGIVKLDFVRCASVFRSPSTGRNRIDCSSPAASLLTKLPLPGFLKYETQLLLVVLSVSSIVGGAPVHQLTNLQVALHGSLQHSGARTWTQNNGIPHLRTQKSDPQLIEKPIFGTLDSWDFWGYHHVNSRPALCQPKQEPPTPLQEPDTCFAIDGRMLLQIELGLTVRKHGRFWPW